ncbi:glycosyltransferase [Aliiglaciecola sp. SL4]|uniref:glycosyltransferase n=1 Tax=Aliiglaciecola sp. SL4 TaxID=3239806 RepID=UPI00355BAD00
MVRIAAFPAEDKNNPYINNFYSALCDESVKLVASNGSAYAWLKNNLDEYDIVHFHWLIEFYNNSSWKICFSHAIKFIQMLLFLKKSRKKVIFTLHNTFPHESRSRLIDWLVRVAILHICECVIVHSYSAKRQLRYLFGKFSNVVVMRHGHYKNNYLNLISREQARNKLNITAEEKVILFVGAIRPYKGVSELVLAFKKLKTSNLKLIIAGKLKESSYANQLELQISSDERIILHNKFIDDEELQLYFNACDLVVLPFNNSLTSGSLLLAYSFNKPVLVPQIASLNEYHISGLTYTIDGSLDSAIVNTLDNLKAIPTSDIAMEMQKFNWKECILPVKRKVANLS